MKKNTIRKNNMGKNILKKTAFCMAALLVLQAPFCINASQIPGQAEKAHSEIKSIGESLSQEEMALYNEPEKQMQALEEEEQSILKERSATRPQPAPEMQAQAGGGRPYQDILPKTAKDLPPEKAQEINKLKEEALSDAAASAEEIAQLEEESFHVAVRAVLDSYYEDISHIDQQKINAFVQLLGQEAEQIAEDYEAALEERQRAGTLDYETEQVLVAFQENTPYEEIQAIADRMGGGIEIIDGTNKGLSDYMAGGSSCSEKLMAKIGIGIGQTVGMAKESLENVSCIAAADYNSYMSADDTSYHYTNDPDKGKQYSLNQVDVDGAWSAVTNALGYCDYTKNKAVIAIIDSGFDITHNELKNVLSKKSITVGERDTDNNFKSLFNCDIPYYTAHGSHVAGIIAAETNNNAGIVGITNVYDSDNKRLLNLCEIIGINAGVPSSDGRTLISVGGQIDGIYYAIDNDVDVINMSFGGKKENALRDIAFEKAHEAGVVLVASAGNENTDAPHYPSDSEHVISVSWLNEDGITKNELSNYGPGVDISAPATNIYSCLTGNSAMGSKKGTSMAAPVVTAAVGLMRAVNSQLTPEEIETILFTTATDLYPFGWDEDSGYGRVNIGKAVSQAKVKAAPSHRKTQYNAQCFGYDNFKFTLSFEVNPMLDFYEVYRSETAGSPGEKKATLERINVINGKAIYHDTSLQEGKTYYYTVVGRIKNENGSGYVYAEYVNGAYNKPIKVNCVLETVRIEPVQNPNIPYALRLHFKMGNQVCTIERSDDYNFATNLYTIGFYKTDFEDWAAERGKGYFYRAYISYNEENVIYHSKYSNMVYINDNQ